MVNFGTFSCLSSCKDITIVSLSLLLKWRRRRHKTDTRTQNRIQNYSSRGAFHWVCLYRMKSRIYTAENKNIATVILHCFLHLLQRQSHLLNYLLAGGPLGGRWSVCYQHDTDIRIISNKLPTWITKTQHFIPSFLKICDINTYEVFTDT